ncbi:MAG: hypothetical protein AABZ92_03510, partial [Verrucomicrobiota bacterium]
PQTNNDLKVVDVLSTNQGNFEERRICLFCFVAVFSLCTIFSLVFTCFCCNRKNVRTKLLRFFKFVDYEGYELGRLDQEIRIIEKKTARGAG